MNINALNQCDDLLSDDLGSWMQTNTRTKSYKVRRDKTRKVCEVVRFSGNDTDGVLVCCRPFKAIMEVTHPDGQHHNIVFVKDEFVGAPEHEVKVNKRGNANCFW